MGTVTESVERAVARGLPSGGTVLVACSGGADSVALAVALVRNRCPAAIGHVDHALRPESAQEAEHVRTLAQALGVPFFVERLERLSLKDDGLEAAAREGRYAALGRLAHKAGAATVATAHTRRDQAETLLLRLIRGAGPPALAGIRRRRELAPGIELIRPLLDVSREETEAYCRENRLAYVTDPHNADLARARGRLRKLWPQLLELNPRLEEALAGAADLLAEESALLDSLPPDLHPALQRRKLLRDANAAGVHPDRRQLQRLLELLAKGSGSLDLPGGRAIVVFAAPLAVPGPGRYSWLSRELHVEAGRGEGLVIDIERAPFPWTLRGHRPGDRLGGEKVSDLWGAIPREDRPGLAALEDAQGRLFWVEGLPASAAAQAPASHPATFRIRPEMKPSDGTLTSRRRPEARSATMNRRPDEEPR